MTSMNSSAGYELTIPVPSPSLNRTNGSHWSTYLKLKKAWTEEVGAAKMLAKVRGFPMLEKASLRIDRYGKRMLDPDNFVGGLKPLIDSLKACGFIVDDSPKHITLTAMQHIGKPYRTVIRLEAV